MMKEFSGFQTEGEKRLEWGEMKPKKKEDANYADLIDTDHRDTILENIGYNEGRADSFKWFRSVLEELKQDFEDHTYSEKKLEQVIKELEKDNA